MKKGMIFLSHVHEDAKLAKVVKDWLTEKFAGSIDVFVSSDPKSLRGGDDWWDKLREKLRNADFILILLTQRSANKRWVYFECGGGYFLEKTVIPICLGHITKANLPLPISQLQAYELEDSEDAKALFEQIRETFDLDAEDNGREVATKLAQVEKALRESQPKTKSDVQPLKSADEISDADARNILEAWVRDSSGELIYFAKVDQKLGLPPGTAKRFLVKAAYKCGFGVEEEGDTTLLLKREPPTMVSIRQRRPSGGM